MRSVLLIPALLILSITTVSAADWPQYRGPAQDGISHEKAELAWSAAGPKKVWRVPTNTGFSSFTVADGMAFTQVVREKDGEPREVCLALDAATGKELWTADMGLGKGYDGGGDGDGPRSTPTISDGKVYLYSPEMVVCCVDEKTGKPIWQRDIIKQNGGKNIGWRNASSVVIDGDLAFVASGGAGQSLLGLNKATGAVVWKSQSETMTHATPVVATILGARQVIFFMKSGLVSVAAADGKLLWRYPFPFSVSTAISPVVSGDIVYCSAGYGVGSSACRISKEGEAFKATKLWMSKGNKPVANHWSTPIAKDGYLYGMFGFKELKTEPLKCVDLATGKVLWAQPGFGQGNVTLVGNQLLALGDQGQLVVVEATPKAYKEVARIKQAVDGKCWSTPAFSDGKIYVRSTKEGACYDVSGK